MGLDIIEDKSLEETKKAKTATGSDYVGKSGDPPSLQDSDQQSESPRLEFKVLDEII